MNISCGLSSPEKPGAAAARVALVDQVSRHRTELQVTPSSRSRKQKGLVLYHLLRSVLNMVGNKAHSVCCAGSWPCETKAVSF